MGDSRAIEYFFLRTLLRISLAGASLILVSDVVLYMQDTLSIFIDIIIVSACGLSYLLMRKSYTTSVLITTGFTLLSMIWQCMEVPMNTTTSMAIILIVGFIFSVLLRGKLMWIMHGLTCASIAGIFIIQMQNPELRVAKEPSEVLTMGITYLVLYFILTYITWILKSRYDTVNRALHTANEQLVEKANEIETQNEELLQGQENLNEMNRNLEQLVMDRTAKVHAQNEMLLKYTYTNAHHLRGPVARLLGLVTLYRMDEDNAAFFFEKVEDQAKEIDDVVRQINQELGSV
jgi:signal transduction histidine kinase